MVLRNCKNLNKMILGRWLDGQLAGQTHPYPHISTLAGRARPSVKIAVASKDDQLLDFENLGLFDRNRLLKGLATI